MKSLLQFHGLHGNARQGSYVDFFTYLLHCLVNAFLWMFLAVYGTLFSLTMLVNPLSKPL